MVHDLYNRARLRDVEEGMRKDERENGSEVMARALEMAGAELGVPASPATDGPAPAELNDSEADNLAYIVADRLSRNDDWRLMEEEADGEKAASELADKVARRLMELSLRLGDEVVERELERPR